MVPVTVPVSALVMTTSSLILGVLFSRTHRVPPQPGDLPGVLFPGPRPDGHRATLDRCGRSRFSSCCWPCWSAADRARRQALDPAPGPRPRPPAGSPIEVELSRQVALLVVDGQVEWVLDASTGRVAGTTPTGRYRIFRQVDGYDPGPLGVLYRPKYFNGGVAVHGFPDVPPYPASHGCVRVTDAAMDWLWATGRTPVGRPVWVY